MDDDLNHDFPHQDLVVHKQATHSLLPKIVTWFKQRENRPIVLVGLILLVIVVGVMVWPRGSQKVVVSLPSYSQSFKLVPDTLAKSASIPVSLPEEFTVDKMSAQAAVSFEPHISGDWVESGQSGLLVFNPTKALKVGHHYDVRLAFGDVALSKDFRVAEDPEVLAVFPAINSEAPENSEITIVFNRPMVPLTTLDTLDQIDIPIEIIPATDGKWKWISTRNLQFIPETRLARATNYVIDIGPITSVEGLTTRPFEHKFSTRHLRFEGPNSGHYSSLPYNKPIRLNFNQPVDLERTRQEISILGRGIKSVPFVAFYGTRSVRDSAVGKTKEYIDKSVLEIYSRADQFGREGLWNFDSSYSLRVDKAYPLEGNATDARSISVNVRVPEIIKSFRAVSERSNYVNPDFFDPQGDILVEFYEEIDLARTKIVVKGLSSVEYEQECKRATGEEEVFYRNTSSDECEKVDDRTKLRMRFKEAELSLGEKFAVKFERIINVEGLVLNARTLSREIQVHPRLTILSTNPDNGDTNADVSTLVICSTNPLLIPPDDEFYNRIKSNNSLGKWRWRSPYRVSQYQAERGSSECNEGEFENTIHYGLDPETNYQLSLTLEDQFGAVVGESLSFRSGKIEKAALNFFHMNKRYNVTTPDKTKLTYAAENMAFMNLNICKISPDRMLYYLFDMPGRDESAGSISGCEERYSRRIELPKKFWSRNYFQVDVRDYVDDTLGHYVLTFSHPNYVRGVYRQGKRSEVPAYEHTLVSVTNIALQEKKIEWNPPSQYSRASANEKDPILERALANSEGNLYWAINNSTLEPVSGASLDVYDLSEGLVRHIEQSTTDFSGIARTDALPEILGAVVSSGRDSAIVSEFADKLRYSGNARSQHKVYIYTDRPIYRPGHTVNIKAIARSGYDGEYELPVDGDELKVKVRDSRREVILEETVELTRYGSFEVNIKISNESPLGIYSISIDDDDSSLQGYANFDVQEFVPSAFKLELRPSSEEYIAGEHMDVLVDADYFFGVPVEEGSQVSYSISAQDYFFDGYSGPGNFRFGPDYYYGYGGYGDSFVLRGSAELDANGEAHIDHLLDFEEMFREEEGERSKIFMVDARVTNPAGQSISGQSSFIVHRGQFYIGVGADPSFFPEGSQTNIKIKTVDTEGLAVSRKGEIVVNKTEWKHFRRREVDGGFYWRSEKEVTEVYKGDFSTDRNGDFSQPLKLEEAGQYEIVARAQDSLDNPIVAKRSMYVHGRSSVSVKRNNNETLELTTDVGDLRVGETGQFTIMSPYDKAKALVTLERGKIFHHDVIDIDQNFTQYTFPVTEDHVPNIYASVTLISPDPEIKFGQINYSVDTETKNLSIDIKSNKQVYLPGEEVELDVRVLDWKGQPTVAELSFAVVDMSVLALKGNPKKNPVVFFYGGKPLTVMTSSNVKNILTEVEIPTGTKGGGGASDELSRRKRGEFRETALWEGSIVSDGNGKAKVKFTLPDNLTTWQVETLGVTPDTRLGVSYEEFIARKQLMVVPLRPRFVIPGDELTIGAQVFNQTGTRQKLNVSITAPTLSINGDNAFSLTLDVNQSRIVYFSVLTPSDMDSGSHMVELSAKNSNFEDTVEQVIPIKPNNTYETTATAHFTSDNIAREYLYLPDNIVDDKGGLTLNVSATLAVFLSDALNYMQQYPYGCSEQIASRLSSLAVIKKGLNIENVGDKFTLKPIEFEGREYTIDEVVALGMSRMMANQNNSGGFSYYSNLRPSFHLTLHVLNTLQDIKEAGYDVDNSTLLRAAQYLGNEIKRNQQLLRSKDLVIITAYTLSRIEGVDGELTPLSAQVSNIIKDKSYIREKASNLSLAHLAMFVSKEGYKQQVVDEIFDNLNNRLAIDSRGAFLNTPDANRLWEYYETPIKNTALYLKALSVDRRESPLTDKIVRWLLRSRDRSGAWGSTNNTLAVIDAFSEYLNWTGETKSDFALSFSTEKEELADFDFDKDTVLNTFTEFFPINSFAKNTLEVVEFEKTARTDEAPNTYYYDMALRYFLPIDTVPPRDEGFAVKRELFRLEDKEMSTPVYEAKVGDVLRGRLTITVPERRNLVSIEDFIPAGVELINFKLATEDQSLRFGYAERDEDIDSESDMLKITSRLPNTSPSISLETRSENIFDKLLASVFDFNKSVTASLGDIEKDKSKLDDLEDSYYSRSSGTRHLTFRPDSEESHDDRLFLFKQTLSPGVYTYDYFVRALIPGRYHHLPAVVSEMYFPENFGRTRGLYFIVRKVD